MEGTRGNFMVVLPKDLGLPGGGELWRVNKSRRTCLAESTNVIRQQNTRMLRGNVTTLWRREEALQTSQKRRAAVLSKSWVQRYFSRNCWLKKGWVPEPVRAPQTGTDAVWAGARMQLWRARWGQWGGRQVRGCWGRLACGGGGGTKDWAREVRGKGILEGCSKQAKGPHHGQLTNAVRTGRGRMTARKRQRCEGAYTAGGFCFVLFFPAQYFISLPY